MHESLGTCYQSYATPSKSAHNSVTLHLWESLEYLNQFQWIPHNIITTYNSFHTGLEKILTYSTENSWQCNFPQQSQKNNYHGNQKGTHQAF